MELEWNINQNNRYAYIGNSGHYLSVIDSINETALRLKDGDRYDTFIIMGIIDDKLIKMDSLLEIMEYFEKHTDGYWSDYITILSNAIEELKNKN